MSYGTRYGDLRLEFTSRFTLRWKDKGSGGTHDGAFWHPVPPAGFKALGSIGVSSYDDANGSTFALCVAEEQPGSGALRAPADYVPIWADRHSGAYQDGSCWRPVPPSGYVALGDVFVTGYDAPSRDDVVCVRADLVADGVIGLCIWDDTRTGSRKDFGAWLIETPARYVDRTKGLMAVNSFVGAASHDKPSSSPVAHCLCLPFPAEQFWARDPPVLTSRSRPDEDDDDTVYRDDHSVWVPFTAVNDPEPRRSLSWQVAHSPFYDLRRAVKYELLLFDDNRTALPREQECTRSVGLMQSKSRTFSVATGVSVTAEDGIGIGDAKWAAAATVSVELGFQTSRGIEEFHEKTVTVRLVTPPQTAAAVWVRSYLFGLMRSDSPGSVVPTMLSFEADSFHHSQFPAADGERQPRALFFELPPIPEPIPT